ncbi:MAG: histidine phosphatase family protein [Thermotogota bacterium]
MNRCELYLFRHAQTKWNLEKRFQGQQDSPLSELGELQSKKMANALEMIKPDIVITSTLKRAKETARIALEEWGQFKETVEMEELKESAFGPWEGMMIDDVMRNFPEEFNLHRTSPHLFELEGVERYEEIQKRGLLGLSIIAEKYPGKKVVVVTHGLLLLCVLAAIREIPLKMSREKITIPDNTEYVRVDWLIDC